jgi:hypothetical protein
VHVAKQVEVDRLLDVAFNSNGIGLLFKVRWAAPFDVPSEDTWEPMRGVDHLNIFSEFLRTDVFRDFLPPMTLSDFPSAGLQEPRRHQDLECCPTRTLVLQ